MKVLQYTELGQTGGLDKTFPPADPTVTGSGNTVHDAAVASAFATVLSAGSFTDLAGVLHSVQVCNYYENVRLNANGDFDGGNLVVTTGNPYNRQTSNSGDGSFTFTGGVNVGTDLAVTGDATIGGSLAVTGTFAPTGDQSVVNMAIGGTLGVTGATTLHGTTVTGNQTISGTLGVTGATTLHATTVTGNETISGTLGVTGATTLAATTVVGALTNTGNQTISGTLGVTGATTLGSTLAVTGDLTETGNVAIGGTLGVTGATTVAALTASGLIKPQQHATAGAPGYVKGALYFDTTANKLMVGGASAWETVTSA